MTTNVKKLITQKQAYVIGQRLSGKTLSSIGDDIGVSKNRVRQIEQKAWAIIRKNSSLI